MTWFDATWFYATNSLVNHSLFKSFRDIVINSSEEEIFNKISDMFDKHSDLYDTFLDKFFIIKNYTLKNDVEFINAFFAKFKYSDIIKYSDYIKIYESIRSLFSLPLLCCKEGFLQNNDYSVNNNNIVVEHIKASAATHRRTHEDLKSIAKVCTFCKEPLPNFIENPVKYRNVANFNEDYCSTCSSYARNCNCVPELAKFTYDEEYSTNMLNKIYTNIWDNFLDFKALCEKLNVIQQAHKQSPDNDLAKNVSKETFNHLANRLKFPVERMEATIADVIKNNLDKILESMPIVAKNSDYSKVLLKPKDIRNFLLNECCVLDAWHFGGLGISTIIPNAVEISFSNRLVGNQEKFKITLIVSYNGKVLHQFYDIE